MDLFLTNTSFSLHKTLIDKLETVSFLNEFSFLGSFNHSPPASSLQEKLWRGRSRSGERGQCEVPTGGHLILWRATNMALLPFWGRREEGWQELGLWGRTREVAGRGRVRLVWAGWGVYRYMGSSKMGKQTPKSSFTLNAIKLGLKIYSEQDNADVEVIFSGQKWMLVRILTTVRNTGLLYFLCASLSVGLWEMGVYICCSSCSVVIPGWKKGG